MTQLARSAPGRSFIACSTLLAMGCEGNAPRNLGSSSISLASQPETEPLQPLDFIGSWVGVARDTLELTDTGEPAPLPFPSGSSRISLVVHGDGVLTDRFASLTFGEGEPPPAPTDPDAPPPGIPLEFIHPLLPNTPPLEGFPYALNPRNETDVIRGDGWGVGMNDYPLIDGIMRMGFYTNQIFEDYCSLQQTENPPAMCVECAPEGGCRVNADSLLELWVRHTPTGLAGVISGRFDVVNTRGASTALGQIQFTPEE
jgi:hypothetical protein